MADEVDVQLAEHLALWRQWIAEKQRNAPRALRVW